MKILRAGQGPAPRGASFVPTARRIDAARYAARLEAERTIAEARAEAERLRAEARERGRNEGRAEVLALLAHAEARVEAAAADATEVVIAAARAVAERALGEALADDARLRAWTREALRTIAGARRVVLFANASTLARLGALEGVELREAALPDGALLATSELGELRVELRTQVDAFLAAIADMLGREVARRA
jgi:hypothetical protein